MRDALAPVYLHLFHGRDKVDEEMDDWGYDGPVLGPLQYVHVTYMQSVKFSMRRAEFEKHFPELAQEWTDKGYANIIGQEWVEGHLKCTDDLVEFGGKFYGDFSVSTDAPADPIRDAAGDMLAALRALCEALRDEGRLHGRPAEGAVHRRLKVAEAAIAKAEGRADG